MDVCVDGMHGYKVELRLLPTATGEAYIAEVVVRELPSMSEVFEERLTGGGPGWALPEEALAAALARGRQYVCTRMCSSPLIDVPM